VTAAGVVLAGGRSSRMGVAKAGLEWHGSTLLARMCGLLARGVAGGPVLVVRAPGQALPALPAGVLVADDPGEGLGPLQGVAAGLAAAARAGADVAFVAATDMPFLHPATVAAVLAALTDDDDVVLPEAGGHPQLLAAAYRTALAPRAQELVDDGQLRLGLLAEGSRTRRLGEHELPYPEGLLSLDDRSGYEAARARSAPEVVVRAGDGAPRRVRAATLGAAARAAGVPLGDRDPGAPLVAGDAVVL
jgi:molybdopterin-guanine dinucleotide biosynthesis protein A